MTIDMPNRWAATRPRDINDAGQIVGYFREDVTELRRGFLYSQGNYMAFDLPNAIQTFSEGISNAGQMVGTFTESSGSSPALRIRVRGYMLTHVNSNDQAILQSEFK